MKKETITMIKLIATKGKILTNGVSYGKEVFLSDTESPDNWHEITEEEYEEIQKAKLENTEV
ncbi:MAG: hypothetical protein J6D52_03915 [Clostridia bacterium]|nr:hypothetical protein [Clostridia bacterium]